MYVSDEDIIFFSTLDPHLQMEMRDLLQDPEHERIIMDQMYQDKNIKKIMDLTMDETGEINDAYVWGSLLGTHDFLMSYFGYTPSVAWSLVMTFHQRFCDPVYCNAHGFGVKEDPDYWYLDDWFALQTEYYVGQGHRPRIGDMFSEWGLDYRREFQQERPWRP